MNSPRPTVVSVKLVLAATVAILLGGCSTSTLVRTFIPTDHYVRAAAVPYVDNGDARQVLDVYVPNDEPAAALHPVVIFFYGGSWQGGSKDLYEFVGEALTSKGYVVVIPDYRTYPQVRFPKFVDDGADAVRWTQDHVSKYRGDPSKIFLMGHSAGAHIAALLGLDAHFLKDAGVTVNILGIVGVAGPYDFLPLTDPKLQALFVNDAGLKATQPINFVRRDEPPLLLLHGLSDTTVLPRNSERLAKAALAIGAQAQLIEYPEYGHIGIIARTAAPLRSYSDVLTDIDAFIRMRTKQSAASLTAPATAQ